MLVLPPLVSYIPSMRQVYVTLKSTSEVRFKEYGTESIEVIDNGSGIAPDDYDAVGKHRFCLCLETVSPLQQHCLLIRSFTNVKGEALHLPIPIHSSRVCEKLVVQEFVQP